MPWSPFQPAPGASIFDVPGHHAEDITSSRVWCPIDDIWADQKYITVDDMFECSQCRKVL